jgi:hypothetical protein
MARVNSVSCANADQGRRRDRGQGVASANLDLNYRRLAVVHRCAEDKIHMHWIARCAGEIATRRTKYVFDSTGNAPRK